MNHTILVSGASGVVGGSLVLELHRTTDAEIVCLVRSSSWQRAAAYVDCSPEQPAGHGDDRMAMVEVAL